MLINPKGSPLFIFRHYATFSKFFQKKIFFKKFFKFYFVPSRETVIFQSYKAWKAHFGCLQSVFKAFHEYVLSIFRKLCASWALDIAPTLDVPVLLDIAGVLLWSIECSVKITFLVTQKRYNSPKSWTIDFGAKWFKKLLLQFSWPKICVLTNDCCVIFFDDVGSFLSDPAWQNLSLYHSSRFLR